MRDLFCKIFHRLSWPRQDEQGCYQVCLDNGRHLFWIDTMPLVSPYQNAPTSLGLVLKFQTQKEIG
jgi:hypothetical protein